ncbi:autoinducer binding domain-containing protein [Sulfitobacter albidus]|uniref:Autoinducer binding domain-containing protein n=1 Tax=Sulfitobacter albidus TaxID=2829501 RepID=A0A975PNA0_9RHOB|nr:LuxR family transcriptional regulator [Sulfitobacter albidus]QUJ77075.1 autoinducer binding domain-containing protein [Sulfitobacter albidus]
MPVNAAPTAETLMAEMAEILHARSYDEVWTRLLSTLKLFDITAVRYGLTRSRYGYSLGDLQDILYLSSMGDSDFSNYIETGAYRRSPHFRWMAENDGAVSWGHFVTEWRAGRLEPQELEYMEILEKAGQPAGYLLSFRSDTTRLKGGLGIMGPRGWDQARLDAMWDKHGRCIEALCTAAHLNITRMPLPGKEDLLRPRQREMLEWIADGKSMQDVAVLTGLSVATVEKHLRGARDRLGVETTAQAVSKAALLGHLFLAEPTGS